MRSTDNTESGALAELLRRVEALTFDCYGTLIDWRAGLQNSFVRLFGPACTPLLDELYRAYVETEAEFESGAYQSYRSILTRVTERLADRYGFEMPANAPSLAELLPDWGLFPDTGEALRRLKSRFRLGIMSNIDRDLLAATSRHFPVEFDFAITAEDVRGYKPGPGHFERLFEQHAPRRALLHVAQSRFHDGQACMRHGLAFVWINRYKDRPEPHVPVVAEFADLASFADAVCR